MAKFKAKKVENIEITGIADQGMSVGRTPEGAVIFVFGAVHIFQVFKADVVIGLGFLLFGLAGLFIFPYMILKVKNGYL